MSIIQTVTILSNVLFCDKTFEKKIAQFRKIDCEPFAFNVSALNLLSTYEHKQYSKIHILGSIPQETKITELKKYLMQLGYTGVEIISDINLLPMEISKGSLHIGRAIDLKYVKQEFALVGNVLEYLYVFFSKKTTKVRYNYFGIFNFLSYLSLLTPIASLIKPRINNIFIVKPMIFSFILSFGLGDLLRTLYELPIERKEFYNGNELLCAEEFIIGHVPVLYGIIFAGLLILLLLAINISCWYIILPTLIVIACAFVTCLMPMYLRMILRSMLMIIMSFILL